MATAGEIQLAYLFSGMLALGAVFLASLPVLHHAWTFVVPLRFIGALVAIIAILGIGTVLLVRAAISDPVYFLPITAVTVGLRLGSPFLLYRRIRDRFEAARAWTILRGSVALGCLGLASLLAYDLLLLASGARLPGVAIFSEQLLMALGASSLILRTGFRLRPHEASGLWPVWSAAVLFALAFVVVLPYAIPTFEVAYAAAGLIGWAAAFVASVRDS